MSFFERMMKLNQPLLHQRNQSEKKLNSNQEEPTLTQECSNELHFQKPKQHKNYSLKSSISIKVDQLQQDQGWLDIFQQPSIQRVYVKAKPTILQHLLPKKQQLMREMLAKKREFEIKKMSLCVEKKGAELQMKVQEESKKFEIEQYMSVKQNKMNQSKVQQMKCSSVHGLSGSKGKPTLALRQSIYSAPLNMQMISSPVADTLNKEIMLKMLSIIEKDRENTSIAQPSAVQQRKSATKDQKEAPIIINNIMKTPIDTIHRDLIEREMKIRMLENTRCQRQFIKCSDYNTMDRPNLAASHAINDRQFNSEQIILTERPSNRPSLTGIEVTANTCKIQTIKQSQHKSSQQYLRQQKIQKQNFPEGEGPRTSAFHNEKQSQIKLQHEQSTKYNSNKNSQIKQIFESNEFIKKGGNPKCNEQRKRKDVNFDGIKTDFISKQEKKSKSQFEPEIIQRQPFKPPVRIEIPLQHQSNEIQGLSLAEAFKLKIGRLKSEQRRQKMFQKSPKLKPTPHLISFPSQMAITITDKLTEYSSQIEHSAGTSSKIINISLEDPSSKRTMTSKNRSKQSSVRRESKEEERTESKKMSQQSKELVDRLIYGERAKVTKEEMYALTKKNYANLPQVQAKRREQQKRKAEQQRLNKARQYQKAIRSSKSLIKS